MTILDATSPLIQGLVEFDRSLGNLRQKIEREMRARAIHEQQHGAATGRAVDHDRNMTDDALEQVHDAVAVLRKLYNGSSS
jgi:hypothetical protein